MDELRDKVIAHVRPYLHDDERQFAGDIADAILALPEIAEAQKRIKELEQQIDLMDGDLREAGYFD